MYDTLMQVLHNPVAMVFLVPIVGILVGGAVSIVKMWINHRERMALIEHGIDPDDPKRKTGGE